MAIFSQSTCKCIQFSGKHLLFFVIFFLLLWLASTSEDLYRQDNVARQKFNQTGLEKIMPIMRVIPMVLNLDRGRDVTAWARHGTGNESAVVDYFLFKIFVFFSLSNLIKT